MRRALNRLANETFDLLIIGGGVTGACVARDAAMRGIKVALVEKNDFANATSAHNSKLVHGGLRYLRNFELGLVRESLKERRIWQRIAPHLVHPLPFLVPIYGGGFRERATLTAGLTLYDALSFDKGWLDDPAQRLPNHSWLNRAKALDAEPVLDGPGFTGALKYYDAQMYAPERLALEHLIEADSDGAAIANYVEAVTLLNRDGRIEGCAVRDVFGGATIDVRAKLTLVAAGPWADLFLTHALGRPAAHKLLRSKGIHVMVPSMTNGNALTVAAGGGHFFVLPWHGHTVLGTTDTEFRHDPDAVAVSEGDIDTFFAFINKYLPGAKLTRGQVEYFYAGLRPLVDDGSGDTYGASRRAELVDHAGEGLDGLFSAIGGKWTTSRDLAQQVVDAIVEKLSLKVAECETDEEPTAGGDVGRFGDFLKGQSAAHGDLPNIEHLARMYGSMLPDVLGEANNRPELRVPIGTAGDIGAQVLYAVREEMALTLADVVMRRTCIGQVGRPSTDALDAASKIMAAELSWSEEKREAEIASLDRWFTTREAA
ncbi:MAG: glycerol-3-phosphate dehydrogenase/oxidase [Alphaproteobacteria bacterium]|nr:glycerol-3-phosphate dehydrogenase/oxidase [Alphaproteobacteria bacterium]MBL6937797.1 glycerol-3-phosphate dehydrogenase/oxidase [Alphaproteobacteria bacterium]MBL7099377.1 glycerol-3-phosphate dehydrogenase/oxidase [Alphaproteobacteria bacterium]